VTIPSNAPSGVTVFEMYVYASNLYGPDCAAGAFCFAETGVTVNAHPSILSLELGAGSGLTVGWLVLLIVILVVAVLLVLLVRRGRTPRSPLTLAAPTTEEMPPPAPAPSTSPATEWSGPKPTPTWREGDSPPPLPTPTPETE
ncbi:MAG: hypothetical protein ACREDE_07285, partial [Thermoplasmata archaeon]